MANTYQIRDIKITKSGKTEFTTGKIEKSVVGDVEKSIIQLSGAGEWKQFHGLKLFVDPSGTIIKGPDLLISRKWDDLERLTFNDSFTVMNSIMRATGATNKSYLDPIDVANKEKILKDAEEYLEKAIAKNKLQQQKFNNYKKQ